MLPRRLLSNQNNKFVTMECALAELKGVFLRENINFDEFYNIVKSNSIILPILREHWLIAADIKNGFRKKRKHFGLINAVLIAKQKELNCNVITGDPPFQGHEECGLYLTLRVGMG